MPETLSFENILNSIKQRNWEKVNEVWIKHITTTPTTPFCPNEKFYEIPELQKILINIIGAPQKAVICENITGVRNLVFYEGLYYFYK